MRKLTESEIELIQTSIRQKGLTAAELIAEIYDHYISHLENYPESEFETQLESLDEKWTYAYCHKLQSDLSKTFRKLIYKTQWKLIKSYFSWPRLLSTLVLLVLLSLIITTLESKTQTAILLFFPVLFLGGFFFFVFYRSRKKLKSIKTIFDQPTLDVHSVFFQTFGFFLSFPLHLPNLLFNLPRFIGFQDLISPMILNCLSIGFCFTMIIYSLSCFEAWKVKSKTAFI